MKDFLKGMGSFIEDTKTSTIGGSLWYSSEKILVATSVFFARDLYRMCITLSLIIAISSASRLLLYPFKNPILNKLELFSLSSLFAVVYGCLYNLNTKETFWEIVFVGIVTSANGAFLLFWIQVSKELLLTKIQQTCTVFKQLLKKSCLCLKKLIGSCFRRLCVCWYKDCQNNNEKLMETDPENHLENSKKNQNQVSGLFLFF